MEAQGDSVSEGEWDEHGNPYCISIQTHSVWEAEPGTD